MKKIILIQIIVIFGLNLPHILRGQDSTTIFSLPTALDLVRTNHPMAKQAKNTALMGAAFEMAAKGNFDPKVYFEESKKLYTNKNYYDTREVGLNVPIWSAINLNASHQINSGDFLNPEEVTPNGGLNAVGMELPILRNLLTDQRRTYVRQAKVFSEQSIHQKEIELNQLCEKVISDYLDWYLAEKEFELYQNAKVLTQIRLNALKEELEAGSKSGIDTLEAWLQLITFTVSAEQAKNALIKSRLMFGVHLWSPDGVPLEPSEKLKPTLDGFGFLDSMCTAYPDSVFRSMLPMQNPVLLNTQLNIKYSSLETKYKKQLLLPQLDLKYNMLSTPNSNPIGSFTPFSDYQFRIKFGSSLILRKERGDYQMAKIKQENAALKYDFKLVEVNNKSKSLWQQRLIYKQIYNQAQATVPGYQELYNAELIRLESGESTIFMVNTREMKMLENDLKVLQIGRKYWNSNVEYLENAGLLWLVIN